MALRSSEVVNRAGGRPRQRGRPTHRALCDVWVSSPSNCVGITKAASPSLTASTKRASSARYRLIASCARVFASRPRWLASSASSCSCSGVRCTSINAV